MGHIRRRHSAELMLMEVLKSLLWFNPFVWLTRRSLAEMHEYQADSDVIRKGYDPERYRTFIFRQLFGCNPDLSSGLADSRTKKRFIMMTKNNRGGRSLLRAAGALPLLAAMLMLFSFSRKETVYVAEATVDDKVEFRSTIKFAVDSTVSEPDEPLILIDETPSGKSEMDKLSPDNITSITVLKDSSATAVYGHEGKNGVIFITTDSGEKSPADVAETDVDNKVKLTSTIKFESDSMDEALILIDGTPSGKSEMEKLSPADIKSIAVLKDDAATAVYGDESKNGVIIVTTNNAPVEIKLPD